MTDPAAQNTDEAIASALRPWTRAMAMRLIHLSLIGVPASGRVYTFPDAMIAPIRPALDLMLAIACEPSDHPEDTPVGIVRSESGNIIFHLLTGEMNTILDEIDPSFGRAARRAIPIDPGQADGIKVDVLDLWLTYHTNNRPGSLTPWGGDPKFGLAAAAGALADTTPDQLVRTILSVIPSSDPTP